MGGNISIIAGGKFTGEFDKIKMGQGTCIFQSGGTCIVDANELEVTTSGYCVTVRDTSICTFRIDRLIATDSYAFFIRTIVDAGGNFFTGNCTIFIDSIEATGNTTPIAVSRMGVGGRLSLNCPNINTDEQYAIQNLRQSGGNILINGDIFCDSTGGGILTYANPGGNITMHGNMYLTGGGDRSGIAFGSGNSLPHTLHMHGDIIIADGVAPPRAPVEMASGTIRLDGFLKNTDGGVVNNGIIIKGASDVIVDKLKIVTDNESINVDPVSSKRCDNYRSFIN